MDYQSLHNKTVVELRKLAKEAGVRIPAGTNKSTLIAMLLEAERARLCGPLAELLDTGVETPVRMGGEIGRALGPASAPNA